MCSCQVGLVTVPWTPLAFHSDCLEGLPSCAAHASGLSVCPASSENLTTTFWATGGLSTFCLPSSSSHLVTKAVWPRNSCSIAFLHQEFTGVLLNLLFPQGHLTFPVSSLRAVSISENFHSPLVPSTEPGGPRVCRDAGAVQQGCQDLGSVPHPSGTHSLSLSFWQLELGFRAYVPLHQGPCGGGSVECRDSPFAKLRKSRIS